MTDFSGCGVIIGSANAGQCFKAKGNKQECNLDGVPYEFFNIDFNGAVRTNFHISYSIYVN